MLHHPLERRQTPKTRHKSNPATTSQQNRLEDPLRLDRNPMLHDPPWPGQTSANVPPLQVRHQKQRNTIRQSLHRQNETTPRISKLLKSPTSVGNVYWFKNISFYF